MRISEYDPAEFPRLLQPIIDGRAEVVYGSRFLGDQAHRVLYFWHYLGNKVLTTASNCFTNLNLTDMETCYKLFRREVMVAVLPTLRQDRFGFEPEVTAKVHAGSTACSRCRSVTRGAPTRRARKSAGKMACRPCGAS